MGQTTPRVVNESIYSLLDDSERKVRGKSDGVKLASHGKQRAPKLQMHINSTQVENLLNPVRGVRDAQRRQGVVPVNHARQNKDAIKQMSQINGLKKIQRNEGADSSKIGINSWKNKAVKSTNNTRRRRSSETGRDFITENILEAGTMTGAREDWANQGDSKWLQKEGYGQVPRYLQSRKMELANVHAARQAAKEAAMLPSGMRIMPDEERKEALDILTKNKEEVEAQLHSLPLVIETAGLINTKASLEKRLREIEEAQKIFSRPKVLVKA
ncbi:hypothetical protein BSKO_10392 [Bryopsis sp. KO-2023]|nr:hypothetical protein BSKO_10392 [Bryopsis sp. KO-2023]